MQAKPERVKFSFYRKLFFLYILNIADWICTEALIGSGYFYEANPIMQPVLQNFWSTILIKGVLPLALILICCAVFKWAGADESRFTDIIINIGISAYALVNLWHILNFVLLFLHF